MHGNIHSNQYGKEYLVMSALLLMLFVKEHDDVFGYFYNLFFYSFVHSFYDFSDTIALKRNNIQMDFVSHSSNSSNSVFEGLKGITYGQEAKALHSLPFREG